MHIYMKMCFKYQTSSIKCTYKVWMQNKTIFALEDVWGDLWTTFSQQIGHWIKMLLKPYDTTLDVLQIEILHVTIKKWFNC